MVSLAVIIVNYRTAELAVKCIDAASEARGAFDQLELVIVDGGSGDGSAEHIAEAIVARGWAGWATLLPLALNGGFGFANNRAIALLAARGPLPEAIALINPDARPRPGALATMAGTLMRQPAAGAVGALLIHEDGRPQASAFRFPTLRGEFVRGARTGIIGRLLREPPTPIDCTRTSEVPWVTGAAVMFRTAALEQVGLFDEGFFLYFEETDLMRRLRRAGWQVWHEPAALVEHKGGAATNIRDPETGFALRQRIPRYWYEARRRYFALAGGRGYAVASGLAWLAGQGFFALRRLVTRRHDEGPLRPARDLIHHGLWTRHRDSRSAAPSIAPTLATTPAWMDDK